MTGWARIPITRIEDLKDAVVGAGLEAIQLSTAPLAASLIFGGDDELMITSGQIGGQVMLNGPLSQDKVTIGLGLSVPNGTHHWMNEVVTGSIGAFLPGDESEALYMPGSFYTTLTVSLERLEARAADLGLVLDAGTLGGTGFSQREFDVARTAALRQVFERVHSGPTAVHFDPGLLGTRMLDAMIEHFARDPVQVGYSRRSDGYAKIVRRAKEYIAANLEEPLTLDAIADAAITSHRSLYRAFHAILEETPQSYVRKLRLNRIRHDLATRKEAAYTVTHIANRWGVSELGRLSSAYRKHFGEFPSETLAAAQGKLHGPKHWQELHSG